MRSTLAACLSAALIVSSAAAQPAPNHATVGVATARPLATQPADIAGSWTVGPLPPGLLSLSPQANGVLTGTLDTGGANVVPCEGQWSGSQFVIQCRMNEAAAIFAAKAIQGPRLAARIAPGSVASPWVADRRLVGKQYFCGFGLTGQEAPNCLEVPLTGSPAP